MLQDQLRLLISVPIYCHVLIHRNRIRAGIRVCNTGAYAGAQIAAVLSRHSAFNSKKFLPRALVLGQRVSDGVCTQA